MLFFCINHSQQKYLEGYKMYMNENRQVAELLPSLSCAADIAERFVIFCHSYLHRRDKRCIKCNNLSAYF
jgi:hypothetical protein